MNGICYKKCWFVIGNFCPTVANPAGGGGLSKHLLDKVNKLYEYLLGKTSFRSECVNWKVKVCSSNFYLKPWDNVCYDEMTFVDLFNSFQFVRTNATK